jgi:hypothetical protein
MSEFEIHEETTVKNADADDISVKDEGTIVEDSVSAEDITASIRDTIIATDHIFVKDNVPSPAILTLTQEFVTLIVM